MRTVVIIFYIIGITISIILFNLAIEVFNRTPSHTWDVSYITVTGIFNIFIFLIQLILQIQNKKFQGHLLVETILVVLIYVNMCRFHAYGSWMYNIAIIYIILVTFIIIKNVFKIKKNVKWKVFNKQT